MNKEKTEVKPFNEIRFEEVLKDNERRIHYHIHRMGIYDPYREFYSEGLYAMWMAYKKYEPNKGPLATYFNYMIRNRLIDMLRKNNREREKEEFFVEKEKQNVRQANTELVNSLTEPPGSHLDEIQAWREVKAKLTEKQWDWVYYYIIQDMPLKEIAEMKGVSVEAVKGWGKEARKKLREY